MFKSFLTRLRGAFQGRQDERSDRETLLIIDRQIREAAAAVERAQRALALAIAQDEARRRCNGDAAAAASSCAPMW
jgi:phage shock protein A